MEKLTVIINQEDVFREVEKLSDYLASKTEGITASRRDMLVADEYSLDDLSRFWNNAIAAFSARFHRFLQKETLFKGIYECELKVCPSWPQAQSGAVCESIRGYFIASIAGQWLLTVTSADAEKYTTQAAALLEQAETSLYSRERPHRKSHI